MGQAYTTFGTRSTIHSSATTSSSSSTPPTKAPPAAAPFKLATPRRIADIEHEYTIGPKLGSGATAMVMKAISKKDGRVYAIKVFLKRYDWTNAKRQWLREEVGILRSVHDHPDMAHLHDFLEDRQGYYVVMECIQGGDLLHAIRSKRYKEWEARQLFRGLLEAVQYLHDHGIVHRDLKPSNILLAHHKDRLSFKIVDFGVAAHSVGARDVLTSVVGTMYYMAPEILEGRMYGKAVDMWSLGCTLYYMLSGHLPFYHEDDELLEQDIRLGEYDFKRRAWRAISPQAKDLISKLLVLDPTKRLTASEALQHPWFHMVDEEEDALVVHMFVGCGVFATRRLFGGGNKKKAAPQAAA